MEHISNPMPTISILLVEDEKVTLELLAKILARKFPDFAFNTAINGRTGLELFKTHTPEMCGVQMTNKIRSIKPNTKFIAVSGRSEKPALQDSDEKEFEFDHFIVKPVNFENLFVAIERCHDEISQQNRNQQKPLPA